MRSLHKIVCLLVAILIIFIFIKVQSIFEIPQLEETYWKNDKLKIEDTSIRKFKIQVPDKILDDLQIRLNETFEFQPPLVGTNQDYGINSNLLRTVIDFWMTKYQWRERETLLNKYPQFLTNIQGLDIHYINVKPRKTEGLKVLPLLLLHGWPGSVKEFHKIIPILTTPQTGRKFVFELIIPSLPGYGFSEAPEIPGMSTPHIAIIMKNLMIRLHINRYYIHGGDWGSFIASDMAVLFPKNISGVHSTICWCNTLAANFKLAFYSFFPSLIVDEDHKDLIYPMFERFEYYVKESGYLHLQATKPDTIGTVLRDSPSGLAAYILEKFITWTNPSWQNLENGRLTHKFKMEDLLDNIMIYWVTGSITTSMRLYSEYFQQLFLSLKIDSIPIETPSGCARFRYELLWLPEFILKDRYKKLVQLNTYEDGGHFAALEMPQVFAQDIINFVNKVEESNLSFK